MICNWQLSIVAVMLPFLLLQSINAQVEEEWVVSYNGTLSESDLATAIMTDDDGNVYVTGSSQGANGSDYVTIKYSGDGEEQWSERYNGPGNGEDSPSAIYIDTENNVYVTGWSQGTGSWTDFFTIKYDPDGNELWSARYNGTGNDWDEAFAICADESGNIYVIGPSIGTSGYSEFVTIKYNGAKGNELWVQRYNPSVDNESEPMAMDLDSEGNITVCGFTRLAVDSTGHSFDWVTIQYDSSGNQNWAVTYDGPANGTDRAYVVKADGSGSVIVTGLSESLTTSLDYATVKYDSEGKPQWEARYNGPADSLDMAFGLEIDGSGGIVVSGRSVGIGTSWDFATVKYDESGNELFASRYDGISGGEEGFYAMIIDEEGGIYVTGSSSSGSDWNTADFATVKYSSSGQQEWDMLYNSPDSMWDEPYALYVDESLNIYVAGTSYIDTINGEDYLTIKYSQPVAIEENVVSDSPYLCRNFPNPFNGSTTIEFRIPVSSHVNIAVYDICGRKVAELVNEEKQKGIYSVIFDAKELESGIYFYRFQTASDQETHKLILVYSY